MRSLRPTLERSQFLDIGEVASNIIYSELLSQTNEFYFLIFLTNYLFILHVWVFCLCAHLYILYVPGSSEARRTCLISPGLEL